MQWTSSACHVDISAFMHISYSLFLMVLVTQADHKFVRLRPANPQTHHLRDEELYDIKLNCYLILCFTASNTNCRAVRVPGLAKYVRPRPFGG
jgi:hypothetical protein